MNREFYWTWLWKSFWGIGTLIVATGILGAGAWLANLEPKTWFSPIFYFGGFFLSMCVLQINCINAFARHLQRH
jgi:hypothetical protein